MKVWRIWILCSMLVLLAGCKSLGLGGKRVDYGAGAAQVPSLEVPPDLTVPASDERYRIPQGEGEEGVATFSEYNKGSRETKPATDVSAVGRVAVLRQLSDGSKGVVINDTFDRSWRKVGLAIERAGFAVEDKDRAKGIYFLRPPKVEEGWLDKVQFWKDKNGANARYRVNILDGGAACEVSVTDQEGASDEASGKMLEAIYRNIEQGGTATAAASATASSAINPTGPAGSASLQEIFDGSRIIIVNEAFDRAWQRVGLAIGRAGIAVENGDRAAGAYFLRPVKPESSLLDKLQFWKGDSESKLRYRVNVKDGGAACEVSATDQDGASDEATQQMIEAIYRNIGQ